MQVALLRADHINRSSLPGIFAKDRKVKFQPLELFQDIRRRQTINIKPEHHQRMNIGPVGIQLAVLEHVNLIIGEENAVAILNRREIYSQ